MDHLCFLLGCFQDFVLMCSLIKMCLGMDSFLLCASCIYKFMYFISSGIFSNCICLYRWRLDIFSQHLFRYCPLVFSLLSFLVFSTKCVISFYFLPISIDIFHIFRLVSLYCILDLFLGFPFSPYFFIQPCGICCWKTKCKMNLGIYFKKFCFLLVKMSCKNESLAAHSPSFISLYCFR